MKFPLIRSSLQSLAWVAAAEEQDGGYFMLHLLPRTAQRCCLIWVVDLATNSCASIRPKLFTMATFGQSGPG